ncbi:putative bifunctional diguanylate cyclase/phosphodiesterase [Paracidobacterium acidisoli]|uniref:EAL domain-containing protein n=1 Tax=Paracidobacterium acidisoli TaxID=2303751 RepID=A0A372IRJ6_9BACT|nr:EAL domain-containing protein [Paracidobacterium acidisoli]MBT9330412.1 EAL domain-containing protein [Paracidobacterium acidisoli]
MQETLPDILILGLLVLVFGSIYRKRSSDRLRYWVLGWLFVLTHFGVELLHPAGQLGAALVTSVSLSALCLSGMCFLLSSSLVTRGPKQLFVWVSLIAVPILLYTNLVVFGVTSRPLLAVDFPAGELFALAIGYRFYRRNPLIIWPHFGAAIAATLWTGYGLWHNQPAIGIYAILSQIFFMNAVIYWSDFQRLSTGVVTSVLGLLAWSAVFPCALAVYALLPHIHVYSELWNIPKYFVEFGMILTLLEDELVATGRQSEGYRLLFESNPHPMWIFDPDTLRFLKVNEAAVQQYGYGEAEFLKMTIRDLRPTGDALDLRWEINTAGSPEQFSGPWTHVCSDGSLIQVEIAAHTIPFQGRQARFVMAQDITERQELHQQLVHHAHHDMLTGLPNRVLLRDRMAQTMAAAMRHGSKAAIVCIDLDRFKQINDTYGHAVGDSCLRHVAEQLKGRLRSVDTIARSGGEEFLILLGDLRTQRDAEKVGQDIVAVVSRAFATDGYQIELSASVGIALFPDHGTDSSELWKSADAAMYRAKRSGGNQFLLVSNEISSAATEASEIEALLRRALKDGAFEIYYQPQFTRHGELAGLEALLRLPHPRLGLLAPDRFIPIAEESGLIVPIGSWVLQEVCRQSASWKAKGLPPVRIAVNVSPLQFMRTDFSSNMQDLLNGYSIDPRFIELEMTETTVMRNLEDAARQMQTLSKMGVLLSVDDFGTGYSSLRHLHQLPINRLKIDRSFIERMCVPSGTWSIVQGVISLAHSLEMQVVAEGVETVEQQEALRSLECDIYQGYLYARPQRAASIPELLVSDLAASRNLCGNAS